jgi:CheY-like chemotaxis protein
MDKKRILIVDDDSDLVGANKMLLEGAGYQVDTASSGTEALEKADRERYDLILLDVMMRDNKEGIETARKLAAGPGTAEIPVVLLTGVRRVLNLPFGLEPDDERLPVKKVLEKPIDPRELISVVKQFAG